MRKYYYQKFKTSTKVYVTGNLSLGGTVDDNYSLGHKLHGNYMVDLVRKHVEANRLPKDSTGIYLILTSDDVEETYRYGDGKMCKDYCGYHLTGNFRDGKTFYFAMVCVID